MKKTIKLLAVAVAMLALVACGGPKAKDVDLPEVMKSVDEKLNSMMMDVDSATLEDVYGISASDVKQFAIKFPMVNVKAEEIIMIQAVSEESLKTIQAKLDERMAQVETTWSQYLPDQYELVKNRKTWTEEGNYVFIIISESADEIETIIKDAFK